MSALLLLMCGVQPDAVVRDYVQSEANLKVWLWPVARACGVPCMRGRRCSERVRLQPGPLKALPHRCLSSLSTVAQSVGKRATWLEGMCRHWKVRAPAAHTQVLLPWTAGRSGSHAG